MSVKMIVYVPVRMSEQYWYCVLYAGSSKNITCGPSTGEYRAVPQCQYCFNRDLYLAFSALTLCMVHFR